MLTFTAANSYAGTTTIDSGTLGDRIDRIVGVIRHRRRPGRRQRPVLDVSAVSGGFVLPNGHTLGGHGTVVGAVTVSSAGSAGSSPGDLTTDDQTWDADGTGGTGSYVVDLADVDTFHALPGVGWDHLSLATLNLTTTGTGQFEIVLGGIVAAHFDPTVPFSLPIVDGAMGTTLLNNPNRLALDPSAFLSANHVTNGGFFSLEVQPNEILLHYVPEPGVASSRDWLRCRCGFGGGGAVIGLVDHTFVAEQSA